MNYEIVSFIEALVSRVGGTSDCLIPLLQAIQNHDRWLPPETLEALCQITGIPPTTVEGVSTFYTQFRHQPVGQHIISICHGTACHVKGSVRVQEAFERTLDIKTGEDTDKDRLYTIQGVACLGCCTLAPVVQIDGITYGHVTSETVRSVLTDFSEQMAKGPNQRENHSKRLINGVERVPTGEIRIGLGSCCMAQGSRDVRDAIERIVEADQVPATVKRVGCVGMCHRVPLVEMVQYQSKKSDAPEQSAKITIQPESVEWTKPTKSAVETDASGRTPVGCSPTLPQIVNSNPDEMVTIYSNVTVSDVPKLIDKHFPGNRLRKVTRQIASWLDRWFTDEYADPGVHRYLSPRDPMACAFLGRQVHLATEHGGEADPLDLDEYLQIGGFEGWRKTWQMAPEAIVDEVLRSGVRGRGGGGFPTGRKWAAVRAAVSKDGTKYVVCNGDEGDPGAFMDRMILESFPYRVLEGMAIAARAVGATECFLYIRAEYPLAIERIREAIHRCEQRGIFDLSADSKIEEPRNGTRHAKPQSDEQFAEPSADKRLDVRPSEIGGTRANVEKIPSNTHHSSSDMVESHSTTESAAKPIDLVENRPSALKFRIKEGAGAFVCGEETALLASMEGKRGMPRLRPPFPAQSGLWQRPTLINNVETYALIPWILRHGSAAFAQYGTESSKGTKVFALAGKVCRGGLIEVPMGITLREIVEEIGGGVLGHDLPSTDPRHRVFKAVQVGGPSGGCVPAEMADLTVDYEKLTAAGAIMGSGGLVVLDNTDCMVDIARYFLQFTQDQSCGKCTFCRVGTRRMLDILDQIVNGHGKPKDLDELEQLAKAVKASSLCGLGKTAPNPVLSTLKFFRAEYEAHLEGRCPAGHCKALITYFVNTKCTGCTICAQRCPVGAIPITPYRQHQIDVEKCTRCDVCRDACPVGAIEVR